MPDHAHRSPSGTLLLNAEISGTDGNDFKVHSVTVFLPARRLMQWGGEA